MADDRGIDPLTEFGSGVEELPQSVDRAAVERMQTVAYVLDEGLRVPGTDFRIGVDPLIGVLPGAGDVLTGGLSMYIVLEAARLGVSYGTLLKLIANVCVDVAGGAIPVVGDVFDAVWKANKRNVELVLNDLATDHGSTTGSEHDPVEIEVE